MTIDMLDFYNRVLENRIIFCFSGPMSQGVLEGIGEALKIKMEEEEADKKIVRKVFSVFVEQMQNVISHSADKIRGLPETDVELRCGIVLVGLENNRFFVRSGNCINKDEAEPLSKFLQALQQMDKEELKAYFKQKRREESSEDGKGAGLGFIVTARNATVPLEFDITPLRGDLCFFSLKVII
jgi:hypothetical protein